MDEKEVENLVKEAEMNREADKKRKESIEARNNADSAVYQAEKTLDENKGKYDEADGKEAQEKIDALKELLKDENAEKEALAGATEALQKVMMKVGQDIYSKAENETKPEEKK